MELYEELLEVADNLSAQNVKGGAAARRAISTAYYALFHALVHEANGLFFPGADNATLRAATARSFDHSTMKQVSQSFSNMGPYASRLHGLLKGIPVSPEVIFVATLFVQLQEARHRADYDIDFEPTMQIARGFCAQVNNSFLTISRQRNEQSMRLYIASLLLAKNWRGQP